MRIFGIAGWSGSGKTTLIEALLPALRTRGLRVATLKRTHHFVSLGGEETEARLRAGSQEALIVSPQGFCLVHAMSADAAEPSPARLAGRIAGADLLLVEGFKGAGHPKLEVWAGGQEKPPLALTDDSIVAIAADTTVDIGGRPCFCRNDIRPIAEFILRFSDFTKSSI